MSEVLFLRNGDGKYRTSPPVAVTFDSIAAKLGTRPHEFFASLPVMHPELGSAHPWDPYEYVVVRTQEGESSPEFARCGFYLFRDVPPHHVQDFLEAAAP